MLRESGFAVLFPGFSLGEFAIRDGRPGGPGWGFAPGGSGFGACLSGSLREVFLETAFRDSGPGFAFRELPGPDCCVAVLGKDAGPTVPGTTFPAAISRRRSACFPAVSATASALNSAVYFRRSVSCFFIFFSPSLFTIRLSFRLPKRVKANFIIRFQARLFQIQKAGTPRRGQGSCPREAGRLCSYLLEGQALARQGNPHDVQ